MDELNPPVLVPEQPRPPEELVSESIPESTPPTNHPRRLKLFIICGVVVFLAVLIGLAVYLQKVKKSPEEGVVCTQEAKQCPDGSYVSRVGPNCAFAPCPTPTPDPTANWKTYKSEQLGISFKHPSDWNLQSRKVVQFPPELDFMITLTANNQLVGTIDHYLNPENLSLEAFENYLIKTDKSGLHMPVFLTTDEAVTLANGATVYSRRTLCSPPAIDECKIYIFPYKGKILIFTDFLRYNQVIKLPAQNEIFNQILSTFKFLDQNQTGVLEGKVTIGPLCPVEPCRVSINPYLGKEVILKSQAGNTVNIKLNSEGSFSGQVNPGTYSLDLNECQYLGCKATLPKTVTIEAGKTAEVNIDIDTGIR